jgi:hypothetical protein
MQHRWTRTLVRSAAAAALVVPALTIPSAARAQVLTFQQASCSAGNAATLGPLYQEAGFALAAGPRLVTWCADSPNYAGPAAWLGANIIMLAPGDPPRAKLYREVGPTAFSIESIDLAHLASGPMPALSVTFYGILVGGGQVTQTFEIAAQSGPATFQTFTFDPAFTNLDNVYFESPGAQGYQFTNIRIGDGGVTTTPEPMTAALTATGLLAVAAAARRRRALTAAA